MVKADVDIARVDSVGESITARPLVAIESNEERNARISQQDRKFAVSMAQFRCEGSRAQRIVRVLAARKREVCAAGQVDRCRVWRMTAPGERAAAGR